MTRVDNAVDLGLEAPENSDVDQLLHPARFYARPDDVVTDELLTIEERRAILSSWASDACAVESNPPLRQPWFARSPVTFDEVMDALLRLDCMTRAAAAADVKPRCKGTPSAIQSLHPWRAGNTAAG